MSSSKETQIVPLPHIERYPVQARHIEPSALLSMDDESAQPSRRLVELACEAGRLAQDIDLSALAARMESAHWAAVWPGEHYRFLAALTRILAPSSVLEIGTFTGLSALSILQELPANSSLTTFDVIPYTEIPDAVLGGEDFTDGRLRQVVVDLTDADAGSKHAELLRSSELIFVDAAKDGIMEWRFLQLFEELPLSPGTILVFDDIRVWNMLGVWRSISRPKFDATSFGHWSGTGLVEWV